jgi:hypothetical protein
MTTATAPAFLLQSRTRKLVNAWRLNIDVLGLLVVNLFGPYLAHVSWMHLILVVYPFMATATILTVDPTRFPEAATTRLKQRAAWRTMLILGPCFLALFFLAASITNTPVFHTSVSIGGLISALFTAFFGELFWRNILQPKLRQIGLSRAFSIFLQGALFAVSWWFLGHGAFETAFALLLGVLNGWNSYRYRTMIPGTVLYFLWLISA